MKILHLLSSNSFSGAENVVCQIIDMFREEDYDMMYCSPDGSIRKSLISRGVKYIPLKKLSVSEVKRIVKLFKPEVIHAHDIRASVIAARFSRKCRIVSHIHGNHSNMNAITVKSLAYLLSSKKFSHIFWVSTSSYNGYRFKKALKPEISSILYNIINIESTRNKMLEDNRSYSYDIVYLGRLCYEKHPERLIGVIKKCIEKNPTLKCAIIGTGNLRDTVEQIIADEGLQNNITLLGFVENPLKILSDAKVMVMTSRYEGTPMCALEAMSLGVPIVSTRTDGMVDVIENGLTGFLSDDDNELADCICRITGDSELYGRMSASASARAEKLMDIEEYMSQIRSAYENL